MLAFYFLALHDDKQDSYATFTSLSDMLAVLSHELTGLLPIVSKIDILCKDGPNEIQKLREN